jgi:hypothetical protein
VRSSRRVALGVAAAVVLATSVVAPPVTAATTPATLRIEPATVSVAAGSSFSLQVTQAVPVATSGAQASINFDPKYLQVVSVTRGAAYAGAPIFLPDDVGGDIRSANVTGHLAQIAAAFTPPTAVPPGDAAFLVIQFRAVACGQSDVTLPTGGPFNAQMISGDGPDYGQPVTPVRTSGGHVTTCVGADSVTPGITQTSGTGTTGLAIPLPLLAAAAVLVVVILAGLARQSRRRSPSRRVAE